MTDIETPQQFLEEFAGAMRDVFQRCTGKGMALPFVVITASPDGTVFAMRVQGDGHGPEILAEHVEGDAMRLPVSVVVLDQNGDALRVVIRRPGARSYH